MALEQKHEEANNLVDKLNEINEQKDKLISIVSHDSRMPIKQIEGIVNMLIHGDINTDEFKSLLPGLSKNIQETSSFMDNLLIWVKTQQEGFKTNTKGEIRKSIEKSINLYSYLVEKKNIQVVFEDNTVSPIECDEEYCHIIVRNLLQNALKFTPDEGKVRITLNKRNGHFFIEVEDNGVGISKEKINQILFPSSEDFNISNGLGLQLVKEFVVKAGGKFQIESKPGKGSIFKVSLPTHENSEDLKVNFAENNK
jgi:signal transduction histidine kinase